MKKIITDPVSGFINLPKGLLYDIVRHPIVQRLTRIKQLGWAPVVYPGAQHTRFQHSLGAYSLAVSAVQHLMMKGNFIIDKEEEAVEAAVLLHDIGHGPFSHVLEGVLVQGVSHEEISVMLMERMNHEMDGQLTLAIRIFRDDYPRRFLHRLVSGQLDVDRLDYLRRDSFYTGVREGNIGSERIVEMLDVCDDRLVVEAKGVYTLENFLVARRVMYWQVYLHKTSVACEQMLRGAMRRAKELTRQGVEVFASPALKFFLAHRVGRKEFADDPQCLDHFVELDDNDVWTALKAWSKHPDRVLSMLSYGLVNRRLFKVEITDQPPRAERVEELRKQIAHATGLKDEEVDYMVQVVEVSNRMYDPDGEAIEIMRPDGSLAELSSTSDLLRLAQPQQKVVRHYLCYMRFPVPALK